MLFFGLELPDAIVNKRTEAFVDFDFTFLFIHVRKVKSKSTKASVRLLTIASGSSRPKNSTGALAIASKARR